MFMVEDEDLVELRRLAANSGYDAIRDFAAQDENPLIPVASVILELLRAGEEEYRENPRKITMPLLMARALAANMAASVLKQISGRGKSPNEDDTLEQAGIENPQLAELVEDTGDPDLGRFVENGIDAALTLSGLVRFLLEYALLVEEENLDATPGLVLRDTAVRLVHGFNTQKGQN